MEFDLGTTWMTTAVNLAVGDLQGGKKAVKSRSGMLCAMVGLLVIASGIACATEASSTRSSHAAVSTLAKGDNGFGFHLLTALLDNRSAGNVIISPFSVAQALTMTYKGARGTTETAIARTLNIGIKGPDGWYGYANRPPAPVAPQLLDEANRRLLAELKQADAKVQLAIANGLWLEKTLKVNPAFVQENKEFYGAAVENLDFAGNPERAADIINTWVNRNTRGKIPTIVEELHRDTALVLTDAVYFKGRWSIPFDARVTAPRPFHLSAAETESLPMMDNSGSYLYLKTKEPAAVWQRPARHVRASAIQGRRNIGPRAIT